MEKKKTLILTNKLPVHKGIKFMASRVHVQFVAPFSFVIKTAIFFCWWRSKFVTYIYFFVGIISNLHHHDLFSLV